MKEENIKLKKCPFCSSEVDWYMNMLGDYIGVECSGKKCGVRMNFPGGWDKETVARKFNERTRYADRMP